VLLRGDVPGVEYDAGGGLRLVLDLRRKLDVEAQQPDDGGNLRPLDRLATDLDLPLYL
jgi:hypothetical protein